MSVSKTSILLLALILGIPASAQTQHTVKLTITDASTANGALNPPGTKYNIYRASVACSTGLTLTLVTPAPIPTLTFTDAPGPGIYCYAATAVNPTTGDESAKSLTAAATIAAPPNAVTITVTIQ